MDHPDNPYASIFPLLEGDELAALTADIALHGLREPIVLMEGTILDGRNRYRACKAASVKPRFTVYDGDDPKAFVVSLNMHRRHLTESQRATVAGKLANLPAHRPPQTDKAANLPGFSQPVAPISQAKAAGLLNVSERSVRTATTVLHKGEPEVIKAVEQGKLSVSAAAEVVKLPPETQREIVARPKLPTAGEARKIAKERCITVAARDGYLYDGRTKKEETADTAAGGRASLVLRPIKTIADIGMTPAEAFAALDLPKFGRVLGPELDELWPKVWPWLEKFNSIWKHHHAQ